MNCPTRSRSTIPLMASRLPLSLWRSILIELWRLILLTTVVLVTVISFAALVKPLADGKLTPGETLRFMLFAMVPMLQYALPFAAGFGATIAYHRLSSDNEVTAAHAGGLSHRAMLVPAMVSGLVLAGIMLVLNQLVMPTFLRSMEQMVTRDVTKIMMASMQRGDSVPVSDDLLVYADRGAQLEASPASGASHEMVLRGVAVVELDKRGDVVSDITTESARLWIFNGDRAAEEAAGASSVVVVQPGPVVFGQSGKLGSAEQMNPISIAMPGGFNDDPKYLTFSELAALRARPEQMNWMEKKRRDLAMHLGERVTTATINERLRTRGEVVFVDEQGGRVTVRAAGTIYAPPLRWKIEPTAPESPIEIEITHMGLDGSTPRTTKVAAKSAGLYTLTGTRDQPDRLVTLRLEAEEAIVTSRGSSSGVTPVVAGHQAVFKIESLSLVDDPVLELVDPIRSPTDKLLGLAQQSIDATPPDNFVRGPAVHLRQQIAKLGREITSKQHERFAMAAACLVMVVAGAVTSLRLGLSMPLTVYLWSFFPALATVLSVSSGQQLTHDVGSRGLFVLWGGVALLAVYALVGFRKVARH